MARIGSPSLEMGGSNSDFLKQSLLTGTAIVLPVLITAFVALVIINSLAYLLNPMVIPIQAALGTNSPLLPQVISLVILLGTNMAIGTVTESRVGGDRLKAGLDYTMARLPGISSIYGPIDRMSKMLLEGDAQNFKDVLLVEFPNENSYALAFQRPILPIWSNRQLMGKICSPSFYRWGRTPLGWFHFAHLCGRGLRS